MPRPRARDINASRLATHPAWLWEVFEAAKAGNPYLRIFPGKNFAVNSRHRYHEFRRDCIHEGVPQAAVMTEMVCSMSKSPPWALTWTFIGNLADYTQAPSGTTATGTGSMPQGLPQPQGVIRPLGDQSESEKMIEAWLRKGPQVPHSRKPQAGDDAELTIKYADGSTKVVKNQPGPEAASLDIPALDLSTSGEQPPPCPPHELDDMTDGCIKCKLPRHLWSA